MDPTSGIIYISRFLKGEHGLLSHVDKKEAFYCVYENEQYERIYFAFKSPLDFIIYYHNSIPDADKAYHEVILENSLQKIRFDVDMPTPKEFDPNNPETYKKMEKLSNETIELIIDEIVLQFKILFDIDINLETDICIYSSHNTIVGQYKRSFHIVVNNYCFENNKEVKFFCERILKNLPEENRSFVDDGVYKSKQNFRIVFSKKKNGNRYKYPILEWNYHDSKIQHYPGNGECILSSRHRFSLIVNESLITSCAGARLLKMPIPEYTEPHTKTLQPMDIEEGTFEKLMDVLINKFFKSNFPYIYSSITNGFILFTRKNPSMCPICERVHDNENAYAFISDDKSMHFFCRRSKKRIIVSINKSNVECLQQEEREVSAKQKQLFRTTSRIESMNNGFVKDTAIDNLMERFSKS